MTSPPRLVVDASVAVKWALHEPGSAEARRLLEPVAQRRLTLLAPDLLVGEVTNVIWKQCALRRELLEPRAREVFAYLLDVLPQLVPGRELVAQALELALTYRHPVYDCMYVALALREGCTLVTADARLVAVMGPSTGRVVHLEDY